MTVSTTEAKNRLTELLRQVEAGEPVIIERHGKPVAQITRFDETPRKPKWGTLGKYSDFVIDPDWAQPQNDLDEWLKGNV